MIVLVIGGTGALGAPAVKALVAAGHEVRSTARSEESRSYLASVGARAVEADTYDTDSLKKAMRDVDAVIRLTTKIPKSFSGMRHKSAWQETNRLRTVGAQHVVDAAIAQRAQVYITESFYAAYASSGDDWVTEESPSDDAELDTMRAVLSTEQHAQRFAHVAGRGVALRFGGFYGASSASTHEMLDMLRKRALPVLGSGTYFFPSLHLDDAAQAIVSALNAPSGTYNVCDDRPLRWVEFVDGAAEAVGAPRPRRMPGILAPVAIGYPWKWMSRSIRLSNGLFKRTTGWSPRYADVLSGLAAIAQ